VERLSESWSGDEGMQSQEGELKIQHRESQACLSYIPDPLLLKPLPCSLHYLPLWLTWSCDLPVTCTKTGLLK
jgi:hypothetical protein